MRSYAVNSPEAVNRLLALTALADGHVSKVEIEALEAAGAEATGTPGVVMRGVLHSLCEDLMLADPLRWDGVIRLDSEMLAALFDEVQNPELRMRALRLGLKVGCFREFLEYLVVGLTRLSGLSGSLQEMTHGQERTPADARVRVAVIDPSGHPDGIFRRCPGVFKELIDNARRIGFSM